VELLKQNGIRVIEINPLLSAGIKVQNGECTLLYLDKNSKHDIEEGIIRKTPYYKHSDEGITEQIKSLYPLISTYSTERSVNVFDQDIEELEKGGKHCNHELNDEQEIVAKEILDWHRTNPPIKETVPFPKKFNLPKGDPWEACDDEFREWLLQQTFINSSITKDKYLQMVLDIQREGKHKPTHEGWEIYQQSIMSTLLLKTDAYSTSVKKCMRIAMLWHDMGKVLDARSTRGNCS
jgi:hypothetical protein